MTFQAFDAAFPPQSAPKGAQAVLGYLGGPTPHIWTPAEWLNFHHLRQAGIWLYDPSAAPAQAGQEAGRAAKDLGWTADPDGKPGTRRFVVIDMETAAGPAADPAWKDAFRSALSAAGYDTIIYESQSVIAANGLADGVWVADWDGDPDIDLSGYGILGQQYQPNVPWENTEIDLSTFDSSVHGRFGFGPRTQP